jgi:hypothetical protein
LGTPTFTTPPGQLRTVAYPAGHSSERRPVSETCRKAQASDSAKLTQEQPAKDRLISGIHCSAIGSQESMVAVGQLKFQPSVEQCRTNCEDATDLAIFNGVIDRICRACRQPWRKIKCIHIQQGTSR